MIPRYVTVVVTGKFERTVYQSTLKPADRYVTISES